MRVEYINPFVEATFDILREVLSVEVHRGELYLKRTTEPILGLAVLIGLTGHATGRILLDMKSETALNIASKLNGMEFSDLDDLALSTISELANMIVGRAVTKLHRLGFSFNVTPPTILTGTNTKVETPKLEALVVPIETPMGLIELNVALKENF